MASLLSWANKKIKGGVQTVNRDVLNPVTHAAGNVAHAGGNVVHAVQAAPTVVNRDVVHPAINLGVSVAAPFTYMAKADIINPTRQLAAQFSHNPVAARNAQLSTNRNLGLGDKGTNFSGGLRKFGGNTAQVGLDLVAPGVGNGIEKSFSSVAPKVLPKLIPKVLSSAGTGAVLGAPFNATSYVASDQPLTIKGLEQSAKQGAQFGAVLGGAAPVVGAVASKAAPLIAKGTKAAVKATNPTSVVHQGLLKTNPAYGELQNDLDRSTQAANKINQSGGSKVALNQHVKNIANIQTQMAQMRAKAKSAGGRNILPKIPAPGLLPENIPKGMGGADKASSANKASSSTVSAYGKPTKLRGSLRSVEISQQSQSVQPGKTGMQVGRQGGVTLANNTTKQRGLTESALSSSEVSPELKKLINSSYTPSNLAEKALRADESINHNLKKTTNDTLDILSQPTRQLTDQDAANAIAALKANDARGNFEEAQRIHDELAKHGTQHGQFINAFKLLSNRTPEGMLFGARRSLKRAGITLDKAGDDELKAHIAIIKNTVAGTPERDMAMHNMIQFVHNRIPSGAGDKIVNFWRAGLLTSPITTGGNILGNTGEALVRNAFVNPVATAADALQSIVTGKRTKTLAGGQTKGAIQGVRDATTYLKTGFDKNNPLTKIEGKSDINYGQGKVGKNIGKYVNTVYRGLGAQDKPFRQAAAGQAATDLAKADAKNLGLKGTERQKYISESLANSDWKPQTFSTEKTSDAAGAFAVFGNETVLGKVAQKVKEPITIGGKTYKGAIRQFILPFTQVPASIAMRIIHRSDLGATETVGQILRVRKGLPYDQRAVSEAIGNGTFGPAAIGAGYALSKAGAITGNYPTDSKEKALWKSEGKQANSVRVGNRWYSLNYMQPFGTLLGIGDQIHQDEKAGSSPTDIISNASGRAAKSIESQSFLQGIDGLLSAVNDPQQFAKTYVNSSVSSVVPNFIRTGARATDPLQRQTNGITDALKGTIPGVRESLPASQDMFGAPLKANDNAFNQLFNPLRPSKAKTTDPVVNELRRLQDSQNGIIPTQFNKTSITGAKLTDQQVRDLNTQVNSKVKTAWQSLVSDPQYQSLNDADKATALKRAKDQVSAAYKRQFSADNNVTSGLDKPASASSVKILTGGTPNYLSSSKSASSLSPADRYKTALDNYNANQQSMSDVQKYTSEKNLAKLKVGAPFSQDVVSLYGLSKQKTYDYLTTHPNTQVLADQLIAYDKALKDAGQTSYLKYSNGLKPATKTAKGRKGKSSKSMIASLASLRAGNTKIPKAPSIHAPKSATYRKTAMRHFTPQKIGVTNIKMGSLSKLLNTA